MIDSINALWEEWNYTRSITKSFLTKVCDEDLCRKLPRNNLNTIILQLNEVYEIQQDYVEAIVTKRMEFTERNNPPLCAVELLHVMEKTDGRLENLLQSLTGEEQIEWFGELYNIHRHICALISHEMMHIGQIVAFCYAVGIEIPIDIIEKMALNG